MHGRGVRNLRPIPDTAPADGPAAAGRAGGADSDSIATVQKTPPTPGNEQPGRPETPSGGPDLDAFAEFDPDAAEKLQRRLDASGKVNGKPLDLPPIMDDSQVEAAVADRRQELHNQYERKERPDPWPIIVQAYPRIAATIRKDWGKRALDEYLSKLAVDERGGRQGFPPDVLTAILEVARLHAAQYRFPRPICPWEEDVSQTKWWDRGR
jgi:hypothetical protein